MEELDFAQMEEEARKKVQARHPMAANDVEEKSGIFKRHHQPSSEKPPERLYSGDIGTTASGMEDSTADSKAEEKKNPTWGKTVLTIAGAAAGFMFAPAGAVMLAATLGGAMAGNWVGRKVVDPYISKTVADTAQFGMKTGKDVLGIVADAAGYLGTPALALAAGVAAAGAASAGLLPVAPAVAWMGASMVSFAAMSGENNGGSKWGMAAGAAVGLAGAMVLGPAAGINVMGTTDFGFLSHFGRPPPTMLVEAMSTVSELGLAAKMAAVGAATIGVGMGVGGAIGGALNHAANAVGFVYKHGLRSVDVLLHKATDGLSNAINPNAEIPRSDVRAPEPTKAPEHAVIASPNEVVSEKDWQSRVGGKKESMLDNILARGKDTGQGRG